MVFSSSIFLLYFLPVFLLIYYLLPSRFRNLFAVFASIFFYAWGAPRLILLVIVSIIFDFFIVHFIHTSKGRKRKVLLAFAVAVNVGMLLYFKYANFFVDNLNLVLVQFGSIPISIASIALPIGISFFTFHKLSYIIDVYRDAKLPLRRLEDYSLYILFFPQLIAGPIIRYNEIADQILDRRASETVDNRLAGFFRFAVGLAKKVMIANVLGEQADKIFSMGAPDLTTSLAWMGIVAYTFQIYFDFSGYSDMALGMGRMMGFKFPENFNNPYISQSISEFWRRWHMTLGRWMRDYLYIPLGGNKVPAWRMYLNLWIVFLISGFWHGAAWNFVVWGGFHGFFLVADRLFLLKVYKIIGKIPSIVITFFITMIGWVLFRSPDIQYALIFLKKMFVFEGSVNWGANGIKIWVILIGAVLFSFWAAIGRIENWQVKLFGSEHRMPAVGAMFAASVVLFVISLSAITSTGFNPFIYFRF
jgi:alginate O-acetyltransferase complex protein AlgI